MESNIFIDPKYIELILEVNKVRIQIAEKIAEKEILSSYIIPEIKNSYILKIGVSEVELFLGKLNLNKINRKIVLYEEFINNNRIINECDIDEIIEKEYKNEYNKYILMQEDINQAIDYTKKDVIREKNLDTLNIVFKELVKQLCPLINIKNNDLENNLYKLVVDSYKDGNLKKLLGIKLFCDKNNLNFKFDVDEYENLNKLKDKYLIILAKEKSEIFDLRTSEIFSNKSIIENENLVRRRKDEINKQIEAISDEYMKSLKKLEKIKKVYKGKK